MTDRAGRLRGHDAQVERTHNALVLGLDEVGRGCLAGPVVAAAVVLPPDAHLPGVDDSKRLSAAERTVQRGLIQAAALGVAWSFVGPRAIDTTDIRKASLEAMRRAAERVRALLRARADPGDRRLIALVDGVDTVPGLALPQISVVGGDGTSRAIAAASIVAKVVRDRFMERLDHDFPAYGFARHKGYGTLAHRRALESCGPCPWHRRSFRPVIELWLPFDLPAAR